MANTTSRLALTEPIGTDAPSELRLAITNHATTLDNGVLATEGTLAARPSASAVEKDHVYRATDTGQWFLSDGTSWSQVLVIDSSGKSLALQLLSNQQLQVVVGQASITWPGGTPQASSSSFSHSLGRTPTGISLLPVNTIGGPAVPYINGANSTTVTLSAYCPTGSPAAGSQPVYYILIG